MVQFGRLITQRKRSRYPVIALKRKIDGSVRSVNNTKKKKKKKSISSDSSNSDRELSDVADSNDVSIFPELDEMFEQDITQRVAEVGDMIPKKPRNFM
ncbi:hypothetical protein QE152_g39514 [Popillia japonica]|uniref:Uncharacterized protein n=1 Tax=Popillia japonica TaxID=7064 RepID=A0AAW1HTQ7_POPJA